MFNNEKDARRYDDIINLPRPISKKHAPMKRSDRAAQFSPFAALTGYDEAVNETARLTDSKIELDEDTVEILNHKIQQLNDMLSSRPRAEITHFVKDQRKTGGVYVKTAGIVRKIDEYKHTVVFEDGTVVAMADISGIEF